MLRNEKPVSPQLHAGMTRTALVPMLRAGVVKLTVDSGTQLGRNDMDDVRRNPNDRVCTHDPKGHNLSFPRRRESIAHSTKSTLWIETNSTIVIPAPRPTAVRPET